jgi:hypothetical protein
MPTIPKLRKGLVYVLVIAFGMLVVSWIYSQDFGQPNTVSEQDVLNERIEAKMLETEAEWQERHRVWSEQEVLKETIAEYELRLDGLRREELSL